MEITNLAQCESSEPRLFSQFYVTRFPFIYIRIQSEYFDDVSFEAYKTSFLNVLKRSKAEEKKIIVLLDLFPCDQITFKMENILKQVSFYKSVIQVSQIYVQHVYILSNRNDLPILIKIFQSVGSVVPYKVVKTIHKIEQNVLKKYGETVDLSLFQSPLDLPLLPLYEYIPSSSSA